MCDGTVISLFKPYLGGTFELMGPLSPLFRPIVVSFNRGEDGSNILVLNRRINNVLLSFSFRSYKSVQDYTKYTFSGRYILLNGLERNVFRLIISLSFERSESIYFMA